VIPIGDLRLVFRIDIHNWNSRGGRSKLLPRPMGRFTQGIYNGIHNWRTWMAFTNLHTQLDMQNTRNSEYTPLDGVLSAS